MSALPPEGGSVLLVTYKFPPMKSVSTLRTWGFYEHLGRHVDNVTVITTSNRRRLLVDDFDTGDAEVHEVSTYDYRRFLSGRVRPGSPSILSEVRKQSNVARIASKLKASFPTNYVFGEGGWSYIRNTVQRATALHRERKFDIILSSFPPYADHVAAYRIKERFPDLYWIADFRDLHVDPSLNNLFSIDYQRKINRQILSKANLVLTVSHGLAQHLRELHPNVRVLRNGVRRRPVYQSRRNDRFTITYTGSMFRDKRRPESILEAIRTLADNGNLDLDNIRIVYAGKDAHIWHSAVAQYHLGSIFEDRGLVSKKLAEKLQSESDLNLLLTYSSPELTGNLTGKLYDYLAVRKPIIAVVNGTVDPELESIFKLTNAGIVTYHKSADGQEHICEMISDLYRKWMSGSNADWEYREDSMSEFYWDTSIDDLVEYLRISKH